MKQQLHRLAAVTTLGLASLAAQAASVVVDVSGAKSVDQLGDPGNTVMFVDIGAHAMLTSLDWTVTLNAFSPSSLSEMQVNFGDSSGLSSVNFAPGEFDAVSGTASYNGSLSLAGLGVSANADGLLRIEFNEIYKDLAPGIADGQWTSGHLTFGVSAIPEPGAVPMALLGLGLVGWQARRMRRS